MLQSVQELNRNKSYSIICASVVCQNFSTQASLLDKEQSV